MHPAYLIIIGVCYAHTFPTENFAITEFHFEYLKSVFQHYKRFSYLLHLDDDSLDLADDFLKIIEIELKQFVTIYNADFESYTELRRPYGIRFIQLVIYKNPWKYQNFLIKRRNAILYDNVIFLLYANSTFLYQQANPFWKMQLLQLVGNMIIIDLNHPTRAILQNNCYYGDFKSLNILENTTSPHTQVNRLKIIPSNFTTLNASHFLVSYIENFPYMYCKKLVKTTANFSICAQYKGSESKLLDVISAKMNFTFNFVMDRNESFGKIMEDLFDRKTQFAIGGISVTYERYLVATFTTNLRFEDLVSLYMSVKDLWDQIQIFWLPFTSHVWIAVFLTLLVFSLLMRKFLVVGGRNATFGESFIVCLKSMIEQNESKLSTKLFKTPWGPFILFLSLLFACMEINTAYKSKLSSIFVRPPDQEPNSVEELIADGYEISIDGNKLDFYSEMLSETDPILIFLKKKGIFLRGFCSQVEYISKNRAAMLNELAILEYYIRYMCPDSVYPRVKTGRFDPDKLRITGKPMRSNPHAWVMQPGVPFWKTIDKIVGQLKNGGFLDKWTRDALMDLHYYKEIPYSRNNFAESDANLNTYSSSFLIYVIGILISISVFAAELCLFAIRKKNLRNTCGKKLYTE